MESLRNRILSFVLSLVVLINMIGCSNNKYKEKEETAIVSSVIMDNKYDRKAKPAVFSNSVLEDIKERKQLEIVINSSIAKLDEINPEYNYKEFYYNQENIEEILEVANTISECPSTEVLSREELIDWIINNSLKQEEHQVNTERYIDFQVSIKLALANFMSELNKEDICKLKSISIVDRNLDEYGEAVIGFYDVNKNQIVIDYEEAKSYYSHYESNSDVSFFAYLAEIIQHELYHVRQSICEHRSENGQINHSIDYNGLYSLIEASAISKMYSDEVNNFRIDDDKDSLDYLYYDERCAQANLLLMGMFKDNFSLEKYYECIFNSDLKSLYEMYELETTNDYITFYNIMYAMDTLNGRSELATSIYKDKVSLTRGQMQQEVGSTYKIYMFREIIKDLITRLNKKDITFTECMYLYNYVKANILYNADNLQFLEDGSYVVDEEGKGIRKYEDTFVNHIIDIEKIFYEVVCEFYDVSLEEISNFDKKRSDINNLLDYERLDMQKVVFGEEEALKNILNKFSVIKEIDFTRLVIDYDIEKFEEYINGEGRTRKN